MLDLLDFHFSAQFRQSSLACYSEASEYRGGFCRFPAHLFIAIPSVFVARHAPASQALVNVSAQVLMVNRLVSGSRDIPSCGQGFPRGSRPMTGTAAADSAPVKTDVFTASQGSRRRCHGPSTFDMQDVRQRRQLELQCCQEKPGTLQIFPDLVQ